MAKFDTIDEYLKSLNEEANEMYLKLKKLILSIDSSIKEKLFAGQVAFYVEENLKRTFHESPVIVLSFYKNHVNVFASGNRKCMSLLNEYKFTEKGTMQINYKDILQKEILIKLFQSSLDL